MSAENAEAFVVAVSNAVGGEPVGDEAFAIGLDECAGPGGDGFVEFDLGVEIAAVEEDFVEAAVAEGALEGLLAAGVFFGSGFASAADTFVAGSFVFESDGFANGLGGGMGGATHVVF